MDLCDKHFKPLKEYVGIGVKVPSVRRSTSSTRPSKSNLADVRAWGQTNGFKVGDRGRIPAEVMDAYNKAHEA